MKHVTLLVSLSVLLGLSQIVTPAAEFYQNDRSPAKNPPAMHLFPQGGELHGWISGLEDLDGQQVEFRAGEEKASAEIDADNRFHFKIGGEEAKTYTLSQGDLTRIVTIPPAKAEVPVAFFVIDRSVFRPNTELQFAAFLRQADADGKWQPLQRDSVEVEIKSVSKDITTAKLKLAPDDFGRITGSYTFSKADPLDDYRISVVGLGGSATVKVAEFRKAKVRLDITSEREADTLKLKFRALDFLNKTVPASKLRFSARVVRKIEPASDLWGLDPQAFPGWEDRDDHWYALSAEQQAMIRSGVPSPGGATRSEMVHTVDEELVVGDDGVVEFPIALDPAWTQGHHLEIDGVLIDANQREQKSSRSLPLGEKSDETLVVRADVDELPAGGTFKFTATTSTKSPVTFVAFRLRNQPAQSIFDWQPQLHNFSRDGLLQSDTQLQFAPSGLYFAPGDQVRGRGQRYRVPTVNPSSVISREFLSLKPGVRGAVADGEHAEFGASMSFAQPGAYVIQALTHDPAGLELRSETTIVVGQKIRSNGIYLSLAEQRLQRGKALRGRVQSRYEGARILLALRDSAGIRSLHPVTIKDGRADFSLEVPDDLSLGCATARYNDAGQTLHFDRRRFLAEPSPAELEIASKVPAVVEPGDEVELELDVNREEEVDLVVSVYDESLLGIAPDRPVDGHSLFYADLRVEDAAAETMLSTFLGGLTLAHVSEELDGLLEDDAFVKTQQGHYLRQLAAVIKRNEINLQSVRTILAWWGAPLQISQSHSGYWSLKLAEADYDVPLLDLIRRPGRHYQSLLDFQVVGGYLAINLNRQENGVDQLWVLDPILQMSSGYSPYVYGGYSDLMLFGLGNSNLFHGGLGGGGVSRGDSHHSFFNVSGNGMATANAMHSNISAQAAFSHLPAAVHLAPLAVPDGIAATTIRRDFSDSAFFNAKVRTGADGKAKVKFQLPDSLTNWRVVVTAVTRDLQIARHTDSFKTFKPVMVWPMLSQGFTSGDRAKIFATVHNHTEEEQEFTVSTSVKNGTLHGDAEQSITVPAKSNGAVYFDYEAGSAGFTEILMAAKCAAGEDASLKRLPVVPCSAEQVITRSGFVGSDASFDVPDGVGLAQARLEVTIAPSLAGDMMDSLDYLVDYPHGCVEQTMSRFLPVIKVAQILERFEIDDPKLKKMVPKYADAGIKRLLQLQREDGGWGWNGNSNTHEMMTPYALFGLLEAEKAGFEIPNETAVPRGMERLVGFITTMGDRQSADRIYCMWVYSQHAKLREEWWSWLQQVVDRTLATEADKSKLLSDYAAALALELAVADQRDELADRLARLLVHRCKRSGATVHWTSANFSRWGNDRFEITAAVLKAFAAYDAGHAIVPSILNYFVSTKRGKRWNSTKDTAMILYAMCDYLSTQDATGEREAVVTTMLINGKHRDIENPSWKPATLVIEGADLKPGRNQLEFVEGDKKHLYRVVFRYWRDGSDIEPLAQGATVKRRFELLDDSGKLIRQLESGDTVPRGSYIRSQLSARVMSGRRFDYTLSANPKPSCAEYTPLHDKQGGSPHVLKESKAAATYWHHEQGGSSLVTNAVYRAELAGEFLIAPGYVELMYDTEIRGHSGSFMLRVGD